MAVVLPCLHLYCASCLDLPGFSLEFVSSKLPLPRSPSPHRCRPRIGVHPEKEIIASSYQAVPNPCPTVRESKSRNRCSGALSRATARASTHLRPPCRARFFSVTHFFFFPEPSGAGQFCPERRASERLATSASRHSPPNRTPLPPSTKRSPEAECANKMLPP